MAIGTILRMLGCEPGRDSQGALHDVRLIPAAELGRPRIDVFVQTYGAGCTGFICDNAKLRAMIAGQAPDDLREAYEAAIDEVRVGSGAEPGHGAPFEQERDPIAKAAGLVRENPVLTAGLLGVTLALAAIVLVGARRGARRYRNTKTQSSLDGGS